MLTIAKRKWSLTTRSCGTVLSWPVSHLGTDQHGSWLGARRGNPVLQADGRTERQQQDAVWLITEDVWWLTAFWFTAKTDLTIDICTPPVLHDQTWSFVDLELDLFRASDGHAGIVDQDEFDALAASGLLTEHEISTTVSSARGLPPQILARTEPFGDVARSWLRGLGHGGGGGESLIR